MCNEVKNFNEFAPNNGRKNKNKIQSYCKPCYSIYHRNYYRKRIKEDEEYRTRTYRNKRLYKEKQSLILREYTYNYLLQHPCIDCGINDVRVLEFDHKSSSDKTTNISSLLSRSRYKKNQFEILRSEIEKCDVRCANCHLIKTSKERNYWKEEYLNPNVKSYI